MAGLDVAASGRQVRAVTGWVPQDRTVDPLLTTQENVTFMAGMYHLSAKDGRPRAAELLRQAWTSTKTSWHGICPAACAASWRSR